MQSLNKILIGISFVLASNYLMADNDIIYYKSPKSRISIPVAVFFTNREGKSDKIPVVLKVEKENNLFYRVDSNVYICLDSSKKVEVEKFETKEPGYYKISSYVNLSTDQDKSNDTIVGFFWIKDTVKPVEPWPWNEYIPYFWEGFIGWPARPWIKRQWLQASSNWHLRKGGWPWTSNQGNYVCLRGNAKGRCREILCSPIIPWTYNKDSLMVKFKVLFWPLKQNMKFKAQLVYSINGGKTWPYVLKSYSNYKEGYDTFKIKIDSATPNPKLKLAWIYSGNLSDIVAWGIDDVAVISPVITALDVAPREIDWKPEIVTLKDSQDIWFSIENLGGGKVKKFKAEAWIGNVHSETIITQFDWFAKSYVKLKVPVPGVGRHIVKVITSFQNYQDDVPANDTVYENMLVMALPSEANETEAEIFEVKAGFFKLYQNYPNPFTKSTFIKYELPQTVKVKLSIYDIMGKIIRTLINEEQTQGSYWAFWDSKCDNGTKVSSGIYFYRLETENVKLIQKVVVTK